MPELVVVKRFGMVEEGEEVEGKEAEKRVKKRKMGERERDMIKMRKRKETRGFTWTEEMGYSGARRQVGG